jgi:MFS family permease
VTGIEHTRVRDGGQNTGEHHEAQVQIDRPAQPHLHAPAEGAAPLTLAAALAPVAALLCSVALLLMGNGLQGTLIPVRANLESFRAFELGLLGTAYFFGFTAGCVHGPALVRRAGHIRAYLAMTSVASGIALLHPMMVDPVIWWGLRIATGYCFAVLYIIIESWINERADNRVRGTVFSVYTIVNLTVITLGQLMLGFADPNSFILFALASILVSFAALPVAFTAAAHPKMVERVHPRLRDLASISPVGTAGCFAVGLANGAFWTLGPVFASDAGLDTRGIGYFMSAVVLGGAFAQWPLGRVSDDMDRRFVMLIATAIALGAAIALMIIPQIDRTSMIIAGAVFGMGAFPLYPLAVAHANDNARPDQFVEVSSGLLLIFGIGAAIGPLLSSLVRQVMGMPMLFVFTGAVHLVLIGFILYRMHSRAAPAQADRTDFADAAIAAATVAQYEPVQATPTELK